MVGIYLLPSEASLSIIERYFMAVVWALRHVARYTTYLPFVTVVFQSTKELKSVYVDAIHRRVKIKMIELSSYSVKFESGDGV